MLVHSLFVEGVDLRRLGGSPGGDNVIGDFYGCPEAPGEKELGPFARKCACDSTADSASGSVDHRNPVLQHHLFGPPASFVRFLSSHSAALPQAIPLVDSSVDAIFTRSEIYDRCGLCWNSISSSPPAKSWKSAAGAASSFEVNASSPGAQVAITGTFGSPAVEAPWS